MSQKSEYKERARPAEGRRGGLALPATLQLLYYYFTATLLTSRGAARSAGTFARHYQIPVVQIPKAQPPILCVCVCVCVCVRERERERRERERQSERVSEREL
jgi:hypothetical protein